MRPFHIFKAGRHTSSNGETLDFSEHDLQATAEAYKTDLHEAPITVGHPKDNEPAYGWIGSLAARSGHLEAAPQQVEPQFAEMVKNGRFKKVSASFYLPQSPSNPVPGTYYLRHVAFLGAAPPAIKGLKQVGFTEFDENVEGVVEFMDQFTLGPIAGIFRRLREWLIEKEGAEEADKVIPGFFVEDLELESRRPLAEDSPPDPGFAEPEDWSPPETEAEQAQALAFGERLEALIGDTAEPADQVVNRLARRAQISESMVQGIIKGKHKRPALSRRLAFAEALGTNLENLNKTTPEGSTMTEQTRNKPLSGNESTSQSQPPSGEEATEFNERERKIEERERRLQSKIQQFRRDRVVQFVEEKIKEGKIAVGQKEGLIAFMCQLAEDQIVEFGEGDKATKKSAEQWMREFLDQQPPRVDFKERSAEEGGEPDYSNVHDLARRATEYKDEQRAKGRTISYTEAMKEIHSG